jgi:hypothetical protein
MMTNHGPRAARVLLGFGLLPALLLFASWGLPAVAAERQVIVEEFTNNT